MGNSTEKLAALLAATGRQDRGAFAEFYERTSRRVYGMICDVFPGPDHDDVIQEVFVLAWQRADQFDPATEDAMAWIMTLAHRHAVDQARKATSLPSAGGGETPGTSAAHTDTGTMSALCLTERESLMMAYGAGMTYQKVAESLGVTERTAKGRIRDGVRSLHHNHNGEPQDKH